ncbi:MAG: metal-sensing transcriptional repressor, partial [Gemmatimonadales bacterium]
VEEDRDADEVLMQIASVREALHGAAAIVLQSYLSATVESILVADDVTEAEHLVARTLEVFRKWAT